MRFCRHRPANGSDRGEFRVRQHGRNRTSPGNRLDLVRLRCKVSGVNRAAKLAMLDFAFESLLCERVEFKTDILNTRARKALTAIGATEESVFRSYNYMPGGRRRNAVY